ncbi:type IA DNA topoisomerase [Sphingobacterium faecium]|jgi:DNA topoisomerase-3|uniref:type IA DNA topoisomerase n=1 Tax=Sphingobacterium faecium TaxID=34087 RepID=UPI0004E60142|nr:type IA DNA topoisomerase [Sphingobacterium faecium]WGQ16424.1 DNA topoisomerase 3 [Sphingobacterium faecium]CDT06772.1 DNA topoisomerase TopB [Sphingobacterium sp. PM2-P1-29]SJN23106.1 DNA topoisomerase III [Sphingobacterium faecium PCAi_F2.5]
MKVVIAEKPSVARDLARVMGAKETNDGYISGNGYAFTYAFGHLVQLCTPQAYGFHNWSIANLPIIPTEFKLESKKLKRDGKQIDDAGALKQLNTIKYLLDKAEEVIVATDAGREGELIFRNIYYYLGATVPFKRLWISSQTDKAIKEGFANLKEGTEYDSLYMSARSRSESDWLIGINATQAITLAAGNRGLLSLGRVQTPTLAMICSRYLENKDFKPQTFYKIQAGFEKENIKFKATSEKIDKKELAEEAIAKITVGSEALVTKVEAKETKEQPPLLFDLTSLQQDANKKYGYSADQTLNIAQALYEKKVITYPRTGSRYIGEDVFEQIEELFQHLADTAEEGIATISRNLIGAKLNKRSVDEKKVTDHHALLVTDEKPGALVQEQRNIYNMIAKRMVESFSDVCLKDITTVVINAAGVELIAKGTVIKQYGWRLSADQVELPDEDKNTEDQDNENAQLPKLIANELLEILSLELSERFTKAKPIHTEASLLKAMETSGKEIDDDEMRQAMKDCGLGTPATRAATIETLFQRDYIKRDKKKLIPTDKGLTVYNLVKDRSIAKVTLTGKWEQKLEEMRANKVSYEVFMKHIKDYTERITKELLQLRISIAHEEIKPLQKGKIKCPKCAAGQIQLFDKVAQCDHYARGCDFKIWRTLNGVLLEEKEMKNLLEKGRTSTLKGIKTKEGNTIEGTLIFENFKVGVQ